MYAHGNLANGVLPVRMNWHAIFENTPALNHSDVGDVPVHLAVPTTFCFICVDIKKKIHTGILDSFSFIATRLSVAYVPENASRIFFE